ncbi:unnamed protein product, partial [Rotaria sp. Silwood1]
GTIRPSHCAGCLLDLP